MGRPIDQRVLSGQAIADADGKPDCFIEQEVAVPVETARRLCCDGKLVAMLEDGDEVLSVGRQTRAIPTSLRRALQRRDGGCRFPGCTATRFVDAHHIQHWAEGRHTSMDNLVQLCRHHHRLIHEGGFGVTRVHDELRFRTPEGLPIDTRPPCRHGDVPIEDSNADGWSWTGDSMDYGIAVSALHQRDSAPGTSATHISLAADVPAGTYLLPDDRMASTV